MVVPSDPTVRESVAVTVVKLGVDEIPYVTVPFACETVALVPAAKVSVPPGAIVEAVVEPSVTENPEPEVVV